MKIWLGDITAVFLWMNCDTFAEFDWLQSVPLNSFTGKVTCTRFWLYFRSLFSQQTVSGNKFQLSLVYSFVVEMSRLPIRTIFSLDSSELPSSFSLLPSTCLSVPRSKSRSWFVLLSSVTPSQPLFRFTSPTLYTESFK